jgi:hypothetical protein
MANIYNNKLKLNDNQSLYDSYNNFVMNEERKVFFKMYWRMKLFEMSKDLHGDIVECGVFKGAGLFLWLKMLELEQPHSIKKVIGFDFFDPSFVDTLDNNLDKGAMKQVFDRDSKIKSDDVSVETINKNITDAGFKSNRFELVKGDISKTSVEYLQERPGFRISLLYLDLDLDIPTYNTLTAFWDRIVPGGIIVLDEYAYHVWSEANGVDRFFKGKNITLHNTFIDSPTAYIIKK